MAEKKAKGYYRWFISCRCKMWLYACGREDLLLKKSTDLYKTHRLCSKHFNREMFVNSDAMDRLLALAVPNSYQENVQSNREYKEVTLYSVTKQS